ncbi:MAG: M16 family metallopeptidase [Phycisphaerales bacterium]
MPVTFEHATLPNGLTIVGEIDRDAHTSACGFFVKTGARDETSDLMGVSHFLEHMMFKGTDRRTADDINREFDELGAKYNAYTSSEITCFYAQTLPEHTAQAVDLLADMMRPALRDEDFNQERNVIL